jgi:O-acetyl-ADP-ribose deacetylase (regulator of RNase III)
MITYKKGNLLEFTEDAFGHGCNCQSTMGSGVAKAVRAKFPELYTIADCQSPLSKDDKLGKFSYLELPEGKLGLNIYSQFDYKGRNVGKMDLSYGALENGLEGACMFLIKEGKKTLALPKIGAGLAGGDWNVIEGIIKRVSDKTGIDITIYEL